MNDEAQNVRTTSDATPSECAINDAWASDVIDLLHLLAGDLSHDSRLVAVAARQLILNAPRLDADQGDGDWVAWSGGECPTDPDDKVFVQFRDGTSSKAVDASDLDWHHDGYGTDIVMWCNAN